MIKRISDLSTKNKVVGAAVLLVLLFDLRCRVREAARRRDADPGDTVTASFTRQYKLDPYLSVVKLASVRVGAVTDIERADDGGAKVTMKLDKGTIEKLGGEPSATIRPTLVVGGVYYVELTPGGRGGVFNGDFRSNGPACPSSWTTYCPRSTPPRRRGCRDSPGTSTTRCKPAAATRSASSCMPPRPRCSRPVTCSPRSGAPIRPGSHPAGQRLRGVRGGVQPQTGPVR